MKTALDMIAEAKSAIREVPAREALEIYKRGENVIFLDVRDQNEVNLGKIPGALHVSRGNLETKIEALLPRDSRVIIYCASGNRSAFAAVTLQQMGYRDVASMAGGIRDWAMNGGDIEG
jgi:rhodanese-related sulfurtransferase